MQRDGDGTGEVDRPRSRPNLSEEAAGYLRDQIFSGTLKPGDKIDQDVVAQALNFSRLPVREAVITLHAEGLVENIPRRGAFVAPLTPHDVMDHYTIYGVLSGLAAERAVDALTEDDLATLADLNSKIDQSGDPSEQDELNYRFHQIINRAGSTRRLGAVLRLLSNNMPSRFFEFTANWKKQAVVEHEEILDALRARNADAARQAVAGHLRSGGAQAVEMLRSLGVWQDADEDS